MRCQVGIHSGQEKKESCLYALAHVVNGLEEFVLLGAEGGGCVSNKLSALEFYMLKSLAFSHAVIGNMSSWKYWNALVPLCLGL